MDTPECRRHWCPEPPLCSVSERCPIPGLLAALIVSACGYRLSRSSSSGARSVCAVAPVKADHRHPHRPCISTPLSRSHSRFRRSASCADRQGDAISACPAADAGPVAGDRCNGFQTISSTHGRRRDLTLRAEQALTYLSIAALQALQRRDLHGRPIPNGRREYESGRNPHALPSW